jgi:hypothetical protein
MQSLNVPDLELRVVGFELDSRVVSNAAVDWEVRYHSIG